MIVNARRLALGTGSRTASGRSIDRLVRSILERISVWVTTGADYSAAAAAYEELSRLCDEELHRRGLSRATLGRDVCRAFDRSRSDFRRTA
jgi:hypothetical protein